MTVQNRNRLSAAIAIIAFAIIAGLLARLTPESNYDTFGRRASTYFTDPSGARALYLVMKRFLPDSEIFRRPLHLLPVTELAKFPSTLVAIAPGLPLSAAEVSYLDQWLKNGGQLILASHNGWRLRTRRDKSAEGAPDSATEALAEGKEPNDASDFSTPSLLARYAPGLSWSPIQPVKTRTTQTDALPEPVPMDWSRSFTGIDGLKVLAADGERTLAVEIPVERGRIIAIADPRVATNGTLRTSDNAVWLVTLAAGWGNRIVLFDEYHHGFGAKRTPTELTRAFLMTPWGWLTLQLAGAAMLYIFGYCRRFGRIAEPPLPPRASAVELVDARAGIFREAGAQELATQLIVQHLAHDLAKAQGRSSDGHNLDHELAQLEKSHGEHKTEIVKLRGLMTKLEQHQRLSEQEFISVGRLAAELTRGTRP